MRFHLPYPLSGLAGLLVVGMAEGCAHSPRTATDAGVVRGIWGTSWVLEDIGGSGVLDGAQATLEFPEAGKVAGSGSCNRFFGSVEITGDSIAFGPLGSTRMACADAVMNQEGRYLSALQDAERYTIDGSVLLIHTRRMDRPLRFTPKSL